jgi:hypothetical protein
MTLPLSAVDAGTIVPAVEIVLAIAPHKQIWSNSIWFAAGGYTKNGGRLQTGFTPHSGLATALISALAFLRSRKWKDFNGRISITTQDADFAQAVEALSTGGRIKSLRCGRALFLPLRRSLSRGRIVIKVVPEDAAAIVQLKGWSVNRLAPRETHKLFVPRIVTEQAITQKTD